MALWRSATMSMQEFDADQRPDDELEPGGLIIWLSVGRAVGSMRDERRCASSSCALAWGRARWRFSPSRMRARWTLSCEAVKRLQFEKGQAVCETAPVREFEAIVGRLDETMAIERDPGVCGETEPLLEAEVRQIRQPGVRRI